MTRMSAGKQDIKLLADSGLKDVGSESLFAYAVDCHAGLCEASHRVCCPVQDVLRKVLHSRVSERVSDSDEVEDLVCDILLKFISALDTLRSPSCFWAVIYQIADNTVSDHWRKRYRANGAPDPEETRRSFDDLAATAVQRCTVHAALGGLDSEDQEILRLHYFEELGSADLGARIGTSPAAARQRVSRAKQRLRQSLEKKGFGSADKHDP